MSLVLCIPCFSQIGCAFFWREVVKQFSDAFPRGLSGALCGFAQEVLELGKTCSMGSSLASRACPREGGGRQEQETRADAADRPSFINEHEPLGIKPPLVFLPLPAPPCHLGLELFGRQHAFF
jgi:hypothetical protein